MKKLLSLIALATISLLTLVSCDKKDDKNDNSGLTVSLYAPDAAFSNGQTTLAVSLSDVAASAVKVTLAVSLDVREGYIPLAGDQLEFEETVTIPAGESGAETVVRIKEGFDPGPDKYEAVITIASAKGAKVDSKDNTVHVEATAGSYGPEDPGFEGFTFVPDWSVSLKGEPYLYEDDPYYDVDITLPGIQYFWIMALTDSQLDEVGGFGGLIAEMEESLADGLAEDYEMAEMIFSMADEEFYFDYDGEAGVHNIVIMEFGEDGKSTGRYGYQKSMLAACEENPDDPDDPDDPNDPEYYDRIAVNGTGDILFTFDVYEEGSITDATLEEEMLATGSYPMQAYDYYSALYEYFGIDIDFTLLDFMNDAEYNYADFDAMDNGTYDVLIVGLNEDGNLTGEYNVSTITVDGRALAEMKAMKARIDRNVSGKLARKAKASRPVRKSIALRDGEEEETTPEILGPITKNSAWTAEYLGRYEEEEDEE